jgi:hypothetical protein
MEWHPQSAHTNAFNCADPELSGIFFPYGETHEHFCLDHLDGRGVVKAHDVHAARRILVDPADFNDALTYVCARIRIENGGDIPPSLAQGELV